MSYDDSNRRSLNLAWDDLERAWRTNQQVGGFPAAIEDYLTAGEVRPETVEMLWDIIAGDVLSLSRSDVATLKLLELIVTGSRLDLEHEIPTVPAPVFLAALRERPEGKPASI